jgi:ubiquinol-cytochrome c reductase iron-sulfur subunit
MNDKRLQTEAMGRGGGNAGLSGEEPEVRRRDFIHVAAVAMAGTGTAAAVWPLIDSLNPPADVRATATIEVDLRPITAAPAP